MTQARANLILKATLMRRRLCDYLTQTKEEELAEYHELYNADTVHGEDTDASLRDWIDSLREDLAKTPEEREAESERFCEELAEREAEMEYAERMAMRHGRDEWDDLWADRARECGAIYF